MRTIRDEFLKIDSQRAYLRGDIFYADLPYQNGSEQSGIRPVVIIQNNLGNKYGRTLIVAPITSQYKKDLPVHSEIYNNNLERDSTILLEQVTTIDKNKIKEFVGHLTRNELKKLNIALARSVGLMDLNSLEFII
ncbi:type II toxin-antitoxin system PemK/MazF family toxin [Clostridium perfringens]|uniref:Toxin-antitoxin system, toxin component, MazF family n=1 Tax=Clostridium perfringens TaxID=1502 RepID=A0A133N9A5_CLOPF|nr:type II toxin-antitoxin system PemK/MazF family toxin [Clostridium perfringens]EHR0219336.1 type II toxin-antitoxin system PemK/MazF family toxin [Clostridium perfringens]ELC8464014.1 type II toxin-antitoxin system PemK/MazF family toxin [Clostridium perfringens]KXA12881.1 toxin-antitoxin system, toxin component, MazF family [Clostridium perfringens]MDK0980225.1 type II toxin-antitoxin system PemK/MazF family toxin [Clostridium perfringens]NGT73750.1 type II toxin-antitoxin system PemK/MazF